MQPHQLLLLSRDQRYNSEDRKFKDSFSEINNFSKSFSFGYLHYLSNYSNNILTFSSPKTIDLPADTALFEMLFKKYIDEKGMDPKKPQLHNFGLFKREFFPKVKPYFNTDQEITVETIPGLLMPVKVDLIVKNEIHVYGQSIDLERQNYHIQNDIGVLLMLKEAPGEAKGFLIH